MTEFVFEANVNVGSDQYETVSVQAISEHAATKAIESQYGYKSIIGGLVVTKIIE